MRVLTLLLLALATLPLAAPAARAATCYEATQAVGPAGVVDAEAGTACLGASVQTCAPAWNGEDLPEGVAWRCGPPMELEDLWPCLFCPGPVLW